jgi:hypothetical protein
MIVVLEQTVSLGKVSDPKVLRKNEFNLQYVSADPVTFDQPVAR